MLAIFANLEWGSEIRKLQKRGLEVLSQLETPSKEMVGGSKKHQERKVRAQALQQLVQTMKERFPKPIQYSNQNSHFNQIIRAVDNFYRSMILK